MPAHAFDRLVDEDDERDEGRQHHGDEGGDEQAPVEPIEEIFPVHRDGFDGRSLMRPIVVTLSDWLWYVS